MPGPLRHTITTSISGALLNAVICSAPPCIGPSHARACARSWTIGREEHGAATFKPGPQRTRHAARARARTGWEESPAAALAAAQASRSKPTEPSAASRKSSSMAPSAASLMPWSTTDGARTFCRRQAAQAVGRAPRADGRKPIAESGQPVRRRAARGLLGSAMRGVGLRCASARSWAHAPLGARGARPPGPQAALHLAVRTVAGPAQRADCVRCREMLARWRVAGTMSSVLSGHSGMPAVFWRRIAWAD
jgi:hypothetical protein